jgi:transcriptional regulator with XRE-family HTH domain
MEFNDFIELEMKKRDMSIREFSRFVGLSHSAVSKYLNNPQEKNISIEFMVRVARATDTDLTSIVAMVYPEQTTINPEVQILAERIAQLPPEKRKMIDSLLLGMSIGSDSSDDD